MLFRLEYYKLGAMVKINTRYVGQLHCELIHGPSASQVETDAPKDNQGKGERFSPTDLVGAALGSCILTTLGIVAARDGYSIEGARAETEKEMIAQPSRRIGALRTHVFLPAHLKPEQRSKLEHVALHCPVHQSLHPDIDATLTFTYV